MLLQTTNSVMFHLSRPLSLLHTTYGLNQAQAETSNYKLQPRIESIVAGVFGWICFLHPHAILWGTFSTPGSLGEFWNINISSRVGI